jgi:hypothetical protein
MTNRELTLKLESIDNPANLKDLVENAPYTENQFVHLQTTNAQFLSSQVHRGLAVLAVMQGGKLLQRLSH